MQADLAPHGASQHENTLRGARTANQGRFPVYGLPTRMKR